MSEERRLVTVLFADVTGSTALGESLDPEDLRALLGRFFAIAREVTAAHGGTLEKFIGDAVMAVFGLPTAHGDDASRAVAAALEIRDRVRDDPALGERLPIRIGLNTGEVVATRQAEEGGDFLITGDAVNVAARLVQAADTWAVLVGERTARAASRFSYSELRPVEARGKAAPVRAAEVTGLAAARPRTTPLFGREADLAQLDLVARRSFNERRPYLVSIIAPAGTGKTRLLEEFLARVGRDVPDSLVATAQCLPYGQRLTFWPLRAILHDLAGAAEGTPAESLRDAVTGRLAELGVDDAAQVGARLLATIGAGEEDVTDRTELYAAWRTTFERAAAKGPLVVVFEDLHWSSDSFLDLVEYVTQPRGEARLLMLVLTRPELLDRRPGWGGGRRNHVSLALDPLAEDSIAELVRHLLESASPETVEAVAARAEGNPFYAGELVRSLIDRLGAGASTVEIDDVLASLPDTVQATVLARLDALPPGERRLLQLGSIFGRSFRPAGLSALEAAAGAAPEETISSLLDREMILASGGDEYRFRHILIREVAYGTLPRSERARLHDAAGGWLERQAAGQEEAYAELIAYHYREAAQLAGSMADDMAQDIRRRAVTWLRRAGETAIAAGADVEARGHLAKALEWAQPEELPDIHERIGDTYVGGDATIEAYRNAYLLARRLGRSPNDVLRPLAKLIGYETRFQGSVGTRLSLQAMDELVAEGRELLARADDPATRARFHIGLGFLPYWRRGDVAAEADDEWLRQAEEDAQLGLRLADEADDPLLKSAALDALGGLAFVEGGWRRAREYAAARLAFRDRLNLPERIDAQSVLAWASVNLGDLAEAERSTREALAGLQPGQAPSMVLHLLSWRAQALYDLGRWDEVLTTARRAEQLWVDIGRAATVYAIRGFMSAFDVARARREPAEMADWRDVCEAILAKVPEGGLPVALDETYLAADIERLAAALEHQPNVVYPERYVRCFRLCSDHGRLLPEAELTASIESASGTDAGMLLAQLHRARALTRGDPGEVAAALELFDGFGAVPHAARVRSELGLLTGDTAMYGEGAAMLERLGDVDQLERYEARRTTQR